MPMPDSLQGSRLHGYAIMSAFKDRSGGVLRAEEGSLYPALHAHL
jgi:PadR family transcriptional regulator